MSEVDEQSGSVVLYDFVIFYSIFTKYITVELQLLRLNISIEIEEFFESSSSGASRKFQLIFFHKITYIQIINTLIIYNK